MIRQYNYSSLAKVYDLLELEGVPQNSSLNKLIDSILKSSKAKKVLDLTAGTGQQAIYLAKKYGVVANDLSPEMLAVARQKAKKYGVKIKFKNEDMRTINAGKFDAAISMFNAIGHLSRDGFRQALKNIYRNLNPNGLYIFDIFNLSYMESGHFISYRFIDKAIKKDGVTYVRFNKNSLDRKNGIMHVAQELWMQEGHKRPKVTKERWDMKIYRLNEIKQLLKETGFKLVAVYSGENKEKFSDRNSNFMIIIAKKI